MSARIVSRIEVRQIGCSPRYNIRTARPFLSPEFRYESHSTSIDPMEPPTGTTRHPDPSAASHRDKRDPHPEEWSTTDQAAGLFLLALIYSLVVGGLGWELAGAGHGSAFFLAVSIPGLVLWPVAGAAIAFAHRPIGRWVGPVFLITQYLLSLDTMAMTNHADRADLAMTRHRAPALVLTFITIFLSGQAGLWFVYAVKRRRSRGDSSRGRVTLAGLMMAIVIVALLLAMVVIPARWVIASGL
jgi:hypothetical protein